MVPLLVIVVSSEDSAYIVFCLLELLAVSIVPLFVICTPFSSSRSTLLWSLTDIDPADVTVRVSLSWHVCWAVIATDTVSSQFKAMPTKRDL